MSTSRPLFAATTPQSSAAGVPAAWSLAPSVCRKIVLAPDVAAAASALSTFVTANKQRTLATLLARSRANLAQQLGMDLLDAAALTAAGVDPSSGVALCWPNDGASPVALLRGGDDAHFQEHVVRRISGAYAKPVVSEEVLPQGVLKQMRLAQALPARLTWARLGPLLAIAGSGGDAGVRALLAQAPAAALSADGKLMAACRDVGPAALYAAFKAPGPEGWGWHLGALRADGQRLEATAIVQAASAIPASTPTSTPAAQALAMQQAAQLASALGQDALAVVAGASSQDLDFAAAIAALKSQVSPLLGRRGQDLTRMAPAVLAPVTESLRHLDAPWSLAWYLPPAAGPKASLSSVAIAQAQAAFVVRAQTPQDKATLAKMARRWRAVRRPVGQAPAGALWHLRDVHLGAAMGPSLTPLNNRADWALAIVGDVLVATWGSGMMAPSLSRLQAAQAQDANLMAALTQMGLSEGGALPQGTRCAGIAHPGDAATRAQALIVAGTGGPWAHSGLGAAPQLLLLGPTGDWLREMEALHDVAWTARPWGAAAWLVQVHLRTQVP